jgi:hypothetical protein
MRPGRIRIERDRPADVLLGGLPLPARLGDFGERGVGIREPLVEL